MIKYFIKEFVLVYIITSIIIIYPDINPQLTSNLKNMSGLILFLFALIIAFSESRFFRKKYNIVLSITVFSTIAYALLTFSGVNLLLVSLIYIFTLIVLGRYIGIENFRLGYFSTLALAIVLLLLSRVFLASLIESLNYTYFIGNLYIDIKNVGYNVGRTGWAISLVFLICFLKGLEQPLSNGSKAKRIMLNIVVFLCCICAFNSTSRTGQAAVIIIILLLNIKLLKYYFKSKFLIGLFLILELLILSVGISSILLIFKDTRLANINQSEDISNGRFDGLITGIEIIKENLIIGTYPTSNGGYSLMDYGFIYDEIHMVILNMAANYGVVLACIVCFNLLYIIGLSLKKSYSLNPQYNALFLYFLIIFGIFTTLIEPNSIISFSSTISSYWVVIGCFLAQEQYVMREKV